LTYDVDEASDGLEALARAVSNQPGVVVAETRLTGISGADLCRLLRREPLTQSVPVILLADDDGGDESSDRGLGVDVVMFKPCAPEHLASEIRTLLANATMRAHETTDG
jgi:DNA-binding response OmpR family regulator